VLPYPDYQYASESNMSDELITHLDTRGVYTITMNRPHVHNAFDEQQIARLTHTLEQAAQSPEIRLLVLDSSGKHFCAGADINYMQRMGNNSEAENLADATALARLMKTLNSMPKPTIVRVQGAAYGGAVGLVCCCDIAIGTTSTVMALSEVKIGLVPATIGPYVVQAIGQRQARRWFISGERINAENALNSGLLHLVVDEERLDDKVVGVVDQLLTNSPKAMQVAKSVVFAMSSDTVTDEQVDLSIKTIANIRDSDEAKEGLAAFLEKRSPDWQQ